MKLKHYCTALMLCCSALSMAQNKNKFTVVLDAGHGGHDTGAKRDHPEAGTVMEKNVTLSVVTKLGKMLEKRKDVHTVYTRTDDVYPSLGSRTDLANASKADLFISVHCNSSAKHWGPSYGSETYVMGPAQNKQNLEVAKLENEVIYLDESDKKRFASYNPSSPESVIALKIQQSKYLQGSLALGKFVEDNFTGKDKRLSRGVKQQNLHVLRMNAMPSVLIETGFINNMDDAAYLASDKGQTEIAESIYNSILEYMKLTRRIAHVDAKDEAPKAPVDSLLSQPVRTFLFSSISRMKKDDPFLKGLTDICILKEDKLYKYYFGHNTKSIGKNKDLQTAKDAGFLNASSTSIAEKPKTEDGYYQLELAVTEDRLPKSDPIFTLEDMDRNRINGFHHYTYGKFATFSEAFLEMKNLENKGINHVVVEKVEK